jgi:DNA-directed RNA polymerase subunit M/transcription elongation factor TFIIS
MENDDIINIINDIVNNKTTNASEVGTLKFLTENISGIDKQNITYLDENVDRSLTINKLATALKDIDVAIQLEAGIFEFTIVYSTMKNYMASIMSAIYIDKLNDIIINLDENNVIQNKTLKNDLLNGKINPQLLAFLRPQDLHPEGWDELVRKCNLKEEKKKNIAVTDLYMCSKCKGRRCKMMEIQSRAADESMTKFITCIDCYHVMKR